MMDENEFFRNITLKICGNLEIEDGLRSCIAYLSQHIPADYIYLEKYDENLGAMRFIARANVEKGEKMDALVPLSGQANAKLAADLQINMENPQPVFVINKSKEDPITTDLLSGLGHPASSILGIPLIMDGHFIGAAILTAEGVDRFDDYHAHLLWSNSRFSDR